MAEVVDQLKQCPACSQVIGRAVYEPPPESGWVAVTRSAAVRITEGTWLAVFPDESPEDRQTALTEEEAVWWLEREHFVFTGCPEESKLDAGN